MDRTLSQDRLDETCDIGDMDDTCSVLCSAQCSHSFALSSSLSNEPDNQSIEDVVRIVS